MTFSESRAELEAYVQDCQAHPEHYSLGKLRALEEQMMAAWRWLNDSGIF